MKLLIIEDEITAANRLKNMVQNLNTHYQVLEVIDSIVGAVNYLSSAPALDLVFMDIQLADGLCFDIFESVAVDYPIIFTTAYDEYALQAFKVNSVDYLLKPVTLEELTQSIDKFNRITGKYQQQQFPEVKALIKTFSRQTPTFKYRLLVKTSRGFCSIETAEIAYFYSEDKVTFLITFDHQRFMLEGPLEELEKRLDPHDFIKISRQFIVSHKAVKNIYNYYNSRLKLELAPNPGKEVLVTRSHIAAFKEWMGG